MVWYQPLPFVDEVTLRPQERVRYLLQLLLHPRLKGWRHGDAVLLRYHHGDTADHTIDDDDLLILKSMGGVDLPRLVEGAELAGVRHAL